MRLYADGLRQAAVAHGRAAGPLAGFSAMAGARRSANQRFLFGERMLASESAGNAAPRGISSPLTTGMQGQEWCPYGQGRISAEGARDQRPDDGGSLCFDSEVLAADLPLCGSAIVRLRDRRRQAASAGVCQAERCGARRHLGASHLRRSQPGAPRRATSFRSPLDARTVRECRA